MTLSAPRFSRTKELTPLGQWIDAQLKEHDVSKPQLAAELGCETTTLYRWMQREEDESLRERISAALTRITERPTTAPVERAEDPYDRLLKGVLEEFSAALTDPSGMIPVSKAATWVFTLETVYRKVREREKLFQNIERNVHDVIWTTDLDLKFQYHSPSVMDLRGYSPEEANRLSLDKTLTEESALVVHELYEELFGRLNRYRRTPKLAPLNTLFPPNWHEDLELETVHKDGSAVSVDVRVSLLRNEHGEPDGVMGVSRSIQDRKLYEQKLKELLRVVNTPIASVSRDGTFIDVNAAFTRTLGYEPDELADKTFVDITVEGDRKESEDRFNALIEGRSKDYWFEKTYVARDGSLVKVRVFAFLIPRSSWRTLPPVVCVIVPEA